MLDHRKIAFWKVALFELIALIAIAGLAFYLRTAALLSGPPSGDLYTNNWGFQLTVFFVVWLPATLLLAYIAISIQRDWLGRDHPQAKSGAP